MRNDDDPDEHPDEHPDEDPDDYLEDDLDDEGPAALVFQLGRAGVELRWAWFVETVELRLLDGRVQVRGEIPAEMRPALRANRDALAEWLREAA